MYTIIMKLQISKRISGTDGKVRVKCVQYKMEENKHCMRTRHHTENKCSVQSLQYQLYGNLHTIT